VKVKHQPEFLGSVQEQSESLPGSVEDLSTFFLLTSSLAFLAAMAACTHKSLLNQHTNTKSEQKPQHICFKFLYEPSMVYMKQPTPSSSNA